jgi:hypothetical protein
MLLPITWGGGHAVHGLRDRTDEVSAAPRADEGLETVGAQIVQQLEHGAISKRGEGHTQRGMLRQLEEGAHLGLELVLRRAGRGERQQLHDRLLAGIDEVADVAGQRRLDRRARRQRAILSHARPELRQHEDPLDHRLLRPQRAVVVEGRDALRRRDKIRRAFAANRSDEAQDRLLGRTIVP